MKFNLSQKIILISLSGLIFFVLDRLFKNLAWRHLLSYQANSGIAFSIAVPENLFLYFLIFGCLILIIIVWQLILSIKKNSLLLFTGYWLLLLGAMSNLLDRYRFNFVIDYFNFGFFYNNLADVLIVLGIIILIANLIFQFNSNKTLE